MRMTDKNIRTFMSVRSLMKPAEVTSVVQLSRTVAQDPDTIIHVETEDVFYRSD